MFQPFPKPIKIIKPQHLRNKKCIEIYKIKTMKSKLDNGLSRRIFVKNSTLATTGILSAGLPVGAMTNVYGNKKLKLALVGCGGRGRGAVVQALQADENVELIAMADAFQDNVEKSLKTVQEHFDGIKKIKVNPKNLFSGFELKAHIVDFLYPTQKKIQY